eukprot:gene8626-6058_t
MSILQYSGGVGDGNGGEGQMKTISTEVPKLHAVNDTVIVGLTGLRTDQQTFAHKLKFRTDMYRLNEKREISGKACAALIESMLYEARFGPWFTEPVIASIDRKSGEVYLCATDLIGAPPCGAPIWPPEELFEVAAQAMLSACDRDSLSGYGAVAILVTKDKSITRLIKGRKD